MKIPFVSFSNVADSVKKQIRNCPYKAQTATTGTRPPLVASQYAYVCRMRGSRKFVVPYFKIVPFKISVFFFFRQLAWVNFFCLIFPVFGIFFS